MLARGDALLRAGEPEAARAAFTRARALALRRGDVTLLGEAALGFAGLVIAIVDLDAEAIARLEEALERVEDPALRARVQARLAVELYYAPDRTRSDLHSADAVGTARESGDAAALASALSARHVALWRPDRVEERLAVADEMIAAARESGDRHAELQAHNWRVADLFELGEMAAWREETARHARLAAELHLPSFEWYTPLWAAVDAMLAGRLEDAEALRLEAEAAGLRAGDRNAVGSAAMVRFSEQLQREAWDEGDIEFVADKIANSPAGIAYRGGYAWILAGLGASDRAREEIHATMALTHAFDANWLSLQAELAEASVLIGDATFAATLYDRLAPYAGRPVTAGRAVCSYGAVDRSLGGLAALLGRQDDAVRHLEDAVRINDALGCVVWRARASGTYSSSSATGGSSAEPRTWPASESRKNDASISGNHAATASPSSASARSSSSSACSWMNCSKVRALAPLRSEDPGRIPGGIHSVAGDLAVRQLITSIPSHSRRRPSGAVPLSSPFRNSGSCCVYSACSSNAKSGQRS